MWKIYKRVDTVSFYNEFELLLIAYTGEHEERGGIIIESPIYPSIEFEEPDLHRLLKKMKGLRDSKGDDVVGSRGARVRLAHGMADIDIWKDRTGDYYITHSPTDATYFQYKLKEGGFEKLLKTIRSLSQGVNYEDLD